MYNDLKTGLVIEVVKVWIHGSLV